MQISILSSPNILTADIGGSHITAAIYSFETKTILQPSYTRLKLTSKSSSDDILNSWGSAFKRVLKSTSLPVSGLSVAMPGPFDYLNGISYIKGLDKYEAIYGMNIRDHLAGMIGIDPQLVMFRNDAESAIAGEVLLSAGKDDGRILGITLGSGFGSAFNQNNITRDINLGSAPYKDTIADDYLSTRWFLKRYIEETGITLTGGVKELSLLAEKSLVARNIFKEFAINIGDFLSGPIQHYQTEDLLICGNIAKASKFFLPTLSEILTSVSIKLAQFGEQAALIGAAAMFNEVSGTASKNPIIKL